VITKAQIGTGFLGTGESSVSRTALITYLKDCPIQSKQSSGNTVNVTMQFVNTDGAGNVLDPFWWAEVGLFAKLDNDPDHPEILFGYANAMDQAHADYIPGTLMEFLFVMAINAQNAADNIAIDITAPVLYLATDGDGSKVTSEVTEETSASVIDLASGNTIKRLFGKIKKLIAAAAAALQMIAAKQATNLITNGNMTSTTGWSANDGTISAAGNILTLTGSGTNLLPGVYQALALVANHKYYISARVRARTSLCGSILMYLSGNGVAIEGPRQLTPANGTEYLISGVATLGTTLPTGLYAWYNYGNAANANGAQSDLWGVMVLDLTEIFGAGHEPTAAEMDAYLAIWPNRWFDGTVSLSAKANKVTNPVAGNFAGLDANGDLTDSGKKPGDFAALVHNHYYAGSSSQGGDAANALSLGGVAAAQYPTLTGNQALTNKTYNGYTLGAACAKAVDTTPANGSANLITSGGMFTALAGKAAVVASATSGNFAGLNASGGLIDSGKKAADFIAASSVRIVNAWADIGIQNKTSVIGTVTAKFYGQYVDLRISVRICSNVADETFVLFSLKNGWIDVLYLLGINSITWDPSRAYCQVITPTENYPANAPIDSFLGYMLTVYVETNGDCKICRRYTPAGDLGAWPLSMVQFAAGNHLEIEVIGATFT